MKAVFLRPASAGTFLYISIYPPSGNFRSLWASLLIFYDCNTVRKHYTRPKGCAKGFLGLNN